MYTYVRTMCTYVCSSVTCTKKIDLRHLRGGGGGGGQIMLQWIQVWSDVLYACKHHVYTYNICPCIKIIFRQRGLDSTQFRKLRALGL